MNSSKSSNQPLTCRNIVYVRMNGCAAAVLRRIVASLISVCAHYRIPDLLSVTKTTEPSDTFVKFTLTPQSTLINTTAGLQAARWSRIHRGSPFPIPSTSHFLTHPHGESKTDISMCERNNKHLVHSASRKRQRRSNKLDIRSLILQANSFDLKQMKVNPF